MFGWGDKKFAIEDLGNLEGKNVVITGATAGLGLASAIALAKQGCNVVFSARNEEKGIATVEHIKSIHPNSKVSFGICDFANFESVSKFAKFVLDLKIKLDCLMLNAGIALAGMKLIDGIEEMMLVNHLGPYLLANLLLEKVRQSAPSRIVFVSSDGNYRVPPKPDWEKVFCNEYEGNWQGFIQYCHSKLANIIAANHLNQMLKQDEKVWINSCHPGAVSTNIVSNNPTASSWSGKLISGVFKLVATPADNGCLTQCYLAFSEDVEIKNHRAKYFVPTAKVAEPSAIVNDSESVQKLISLSDKYIAKYLQAN